MPTLRLITESAADPVLDTALSTAVLQHVASHDTPATLRLFIPGRIVAFGSQDVSRHRYRDAVAAAHALGFGAVERLAGGKAAVFHESTIAFAWATPHDDSKVGIEDRFESVAAIVLDSLDRVGVEGAIGEIPGEYCPGRFSVHVNRKKVMGVGQRLVRGAAHVGGVLVAEKPDLVNTALEPTYELLGYEWSPDATGAVDTGVDVVMAAMKDAFVAAGYDLAVDGFSEMERTTAAGVADSHRPPIA